MTFTSLAPRRSDVRQQSIAVLPTPMISTFSPIDLMCSNATDSSQVMPMWMLAAPSLRPGNFNSLPFGAPAPTNTASKPPLPNNSFSDLTGWLSLRSTPMPTICAISSSSTSAGRRNDGMLVRMRPPGTPHCSKIVTE